MRRTDVRRINAPGWANCAPSPRAAASIAARSGGGRTPHRGSVSSRGVAPGCGRARPGRACTTSPTASMGQKAPGRRAAPRRPHPAGHSERGRWLSRIRPGPHPVACDLFLRIGVEAGNAPHPKWGQDVHPALGKILSGSTTATESGVAGREPGQTGPVSAKSPCRGCIFPQHAAVADACGGQAFGPERRRGADPS